MRCSKKVPCSARFVCLRIESSMNAVGDVDLSLIHVHFMSLDNPHLKRGGWTLNVTKRPRIKYNIQRWPGSPYAVLNYFCCAWFKFRWVTIVIKALWLVEAWVWKVYKLAIPKILKPCTSNSTNMNDRFHHSRLAVWHLKRIPNRLLPT